MMSSYMPLHIGQDNWRSRWLVEGESRALHRISSIAWDEADEMISGKGVSVCGRRRHFRMPGIFSRMGLMRCQTCCELLGVPEGNGAPFNALEGDLVDA